MNHRDTQDNSYLRISIDLEKRELSKLTKSYYDQHVSHFVRIHGTMLLFGFKSRDVVTPHHISTSDVSLGTVFFYEL